MASTDTGIIHSNAHISKDELLKKIGGEAMLHRAVDEFYSRLVSDKELKPFFEHANMTVLKWYVVWIGERLLIGLMTLGCARVLAVPRPLPNSTRSQISLIFYHFLCFHQLDLGTSLI